MRIIKSMLGLKERESHHVLVLSSLVQDFLASVLLVNYASIFTMYVYENDLKQVQVYPLIQSGKIVIRGMTMRRLV